MTENFMNQLQPGMKVGKYQIVDLVATGGMSMIYKAYDKTLDRYVAIKQIAPNLAADPKFAERFRREAQVLARLGQGQQNVVAVYELVEEGGGLFMIMEFVDGTSLQKLMDRGVASLQTGLGILLKVTLGLKAIHAHGIVHRDLKPDNIMVQQTGGVKIADFGLIGRAGGRTSLPMGTTQYMAPEMFTGGAVDSRADIYSLGFIAYQMFVGPEKFREIFQDIFADEQSASIRWMHWHCNPKLIAPSLREVQPGIPPLVTRIIERMMEKDLSKRFTSTDQILKWLRQIFVMYVQGKSLSEQESAKLEAEVDAEVETRRPAAAGAAAGVPATRARGGAVAAVSEAAKTAPLPKRRWGWQEYARYGGIVAGAIVLLLIGWAIYAHSRSSTEADQANELMSQGQKFYKSQKFAQAGEKYEEVMAKFADLPQLKKEAEFWKLMSDAELAREKKNWAEGVTKLAVVKDLPPSSKLQSAAVIDLERRINSQKAYWRLHDLAEAARQDKKYDEAIGYLREILEEHLAPADDKVSTDIKNIEEAKLLAGINQLIAQGDALVEQGKFDGTDGAGAVYEAARKKNDLPLVKERIGRLNIFIAFRKLASQAEIEAKKNNWPAAAELYAEAVKQPVKAADQSIVDWTTVVRKGNEARSKVLEKEGDALVAQGDAKGALALYDEARLLDPNNSEVIRKTVAVKGKSTYDQLLADANAAWNNGKGDYDKATNLLDKAIAMQTDPQEQDKLKQMRADWSQRHFIDEGTLAFNKKDFKKAQEMFELAERANPSNKENVRVVRKWLDRIKDEWAFQDFMTRGQEAVQAGKFAEAKKYAKDAWNINNTRPEVQKLLLEIEYQKMLKSGKDAMADGDWAGAKSYLKLAQVSSDTPEVRTLIEECDKRLALSGGTK